MSMVLQLMHWSTTPVVVALAAPRGFAVMISFLSIFVLWSIHFNALDLEFPFGDRVNDLPMVEMQQDWNKSLCTLLDPLACRPPDWIYNPEVHRKLTSAMSDASTLYVPPPSVKPKGIAMIKLGERRKTAQVGMANNKMAKRSSLSDGESILFAPEDSAKLADADSTKSGPDLEPGGQEVRAAVDGDLRVTSLVRCLGDGLPKAAADSTRPGPDLEPRGQEVRPAREGGPGPRPAGEGGPSPTTQISSEAKDGSVVTPELPLSATGSNPPQATPGAPTVEALPGTVAMTVS